MHPIVSTVRVVACTRVAACSAPSAAPSAPPSSVAPRPRLTPIGLRRCRRSLVAVTRAEWSLPSLAAARMVSVLRARGDEVRVIECVGDGLLALPRLGLDADLVVLVDADDEVRLFPAVAHDAMATFDLAPDLVPDFSDLPFAQTRVLPIAARVASMPRALGAVLHEVREYARRHAMPDLVFVDRALNADADIFAGLIASIQRHAPGVQWMAAVRVHRDATDALSRKCLRAAAASGLRSLVLRAEGVHATGRAQELATHARDAGILARLVLDEPLVEIPRVRRTLGAALASAGPCGSAHASTAHAFAAIALKD